MTFCGSQYLLSLSDFLLDNCQVSSVFTVPMQYSNGTTFWFIYIYKFFFFVQTYDLYLF